ncbi:hypothetical protein [Sphingomonas yantingensis]|uniref:DUF2029 domain-containing protein n=1 Tax=Sphingomonas yantingensis TaxID=1241761 RepID=A0A7W9EIE2_9SPHN|nr:hypothetical protein [Sphingomonas yantingensis]MBB5699044.1 hypothetical protein [Sphingomonas yantingensis]
MPRPSILLFALVWLSAAWFGSWHWNPNSAVRLFAAIGIVERHDAAIDRFEALTIDKARFGAHFYLDKPPGMTLMAMPVVALTDAATGDSAEDKVLATTDPVFDRYMKLRQWLAAAAINATLLALAAVALMDIGRRVTGSAGAGAFGALAFALGTPLWGWATTLFGHCAVASLLVIAVRLVLKGTGDDRSRADAPLAGLALGWALVIEHSALLFALPVGIFALWRLRAAPRIEAARAAGGAVLAGTAAMIPLLAYNLFAFGTPFRLGYEGVVGWEGMQQGLFGLTYPHVAVLGEVLAGTHRGMLWVAPVLLAALPGLWLLWRRGWRDLAVLAAVGAAAAFLYNASYVYWDGGNSTGPRHAMPAVAFLSLALPGVWAAAGLAGRAALSALLAGSVAINLTIAAAEITAPWSADNALVDGVWRERFWPGYLRTVPNEFFGWTPWQGLAMWAVAAAALFAALMFALSRQPQSANIYRTDGAARRS